jgi:iron complex transport system substrate-binding protein
MSLSSFLNGAAAVTALLLGVAISALGNVQPPETSGGPPQRAAPLTDAEGHAVSPRRYQRIASTSIVGDPLLVALSEPERVVAFSSWEADHSPVAWQYGGKAILRSADDVEGILALKPDLVLVNNLGPPAELAPLRAAGVEVFDLGQMRGLRTLLSNARTIATLLGHPERGEQFAESFVHRFDGIATDVAPESRRRAIYLSVYGSQLLGGTAGTSFHDVLVHAGLVDLAAEHYSDWPQYSTEKVLTMNPDVIVTHPGMKDALCRGAGLGPTSACQHGAVVEISADLLDDPGVLMLEAADAVHAAVYGKKPLAQSGAAQ